MKKFRAAIERFQKNTIAGAQTRVPAEQIINQVLPAALPPTGNTGAGYSPADHDHTGTSDGGKLTNEAHDGYSVYEEISTPSAPASNTARFYAKDVAGVTELFYKNSAGTERDLSGTGTLTSHNHTSTGGDGGVLTNDEHDGFSEYAEISAPSTPASNKARLYAKDKAGVSALYYKDDAGSEHDLSAGDLLSLIYDAIANGTDDPIDTKIVTGSYVILIYFKGNSTSGWSSPSTATHTVTTGKRFIVVGVIGSSGLLGDSGSRKARLRNTTDSTDVVADTFFTAPNGALAIPYVGDGGASTVLNSAASTKVIELQLWNTDATKRAMGAVVIGREV